MTYAEMVDELRQARTALGISASKLDISMYGVRGSNNAIGKYECQDRRPTFPKFVQWADALGYDVKLVKREELK